MPRSRLWCIFELAAYRSANPTGKITLAPLFLELVTVVSWLLLWLSTLSFFVTRQGGFLSLLGRLVFVLFLVPGIHILRKMYRAKHQLLSDLQHFDLDKVACS